MKNRYVVVFASLLFFSNSQPSFYFWESYRDGERSCCLFMGGVDICNPYVPCTRHAYTDLTGIYNYIARILQVDGSTVFSYHKILNQAQNFIRHALSSSAMRMYYRFDERRSVKFYHEIQEAAKIVDKTGKVASTTPTSTAAADKQKADDAVLAYLIKVGVARPLK